MPELPEVETITRELKKKVLYRTFLDVWTDAPKLIKFPKKFDQFKKLALMVGLQIGTNQINN